jgi:hypothetical protein
VPKADIGTQSDHVGDLLAAQHRAIINFMAVEGRVYFVMR